MAISIFDTSVLLVTLTNATFCGYVIRLLWKKSVEEQKARIQADGAIATGILYATNAVTDSNTKLAEFIKQSHISHTSILTKSLSELHDGYRDTHTKLLESSNAHDEKLIETLKPIVDWCSIAEHYVRELRGMRMKNPGGNLNPTDECGHCHRMVQQYFIDGAGRPTCQKCKPEGFRDAVNRGTARL